jgi:hypothetical protein
VRIIKKIGNFKVIENKNVSENLEGVILTIDKLKRYKSENFKQKI